MADVARETAAVEAERDSLRAVADARGAGLELAREEARRARLALDSAATRADSFPLLIAALDAETRRADRAEALVAATREQLTAAGRLDALRRRDIALRDSTIAERTRDRDRWRTEARDALARIERIEQGGDRFARIVRAGETAAIGVTTAEACSDGVSVGCMAGAVVTLARVL